MDDWKDAGASESIGPPAISTAAAPSSNEDFKSSKKRSVRPILKSKINLYQAARGPKAEGGRQGMGLAF